MANSSESLTSAVSAATGIPEDQIMDKLHGLSIDQWDTLLNAVSDGNHGEVKNIVDSSGSDNSQQTNPLLAKNDTEAKNAPEPAPDQQAPAPAPAQPDTAAPADPAPAPAQQPAQEPQQQATDEDEPQDEAQTNESAGGHSYALGDSVHYDGQTCTVSRTKAGDGCMELLIDGVPRIVKKGKVHPVKETVMGPIELATIARIRALAGMNGSSMAAPATPVAMQVAKVRTVDVPNAPAAQSRPITTPTSMDFCLDLPEEPVGEIKDAFAEIMSRLPDVKQRDLKDVRVMANNVVNSLNETKFSFFKSLQEK